jgi:hypothetical protein
MRTTWNVFPSCCLLLAALVLAGCGASSNSSSSAEAEAREAQVNREVALQSPALGNTGALPSRYTCDGGNVRLPLRWASVPPGTKELALVVVSVQPARTPEGKVTNTLVPTWAVAGLPPTLRELASGRLPRGTIVGRDEQGDPHYSICPRKGVKWHYIVALFTLPRPIRAVPGVNDQVLFSYLAKANTPYGELLVNYTRR